MKSKEWSLKVGVTMLFETPVDEKECIDAFIAELKKTILEFDSATAINKEESIRQTYPQPYCKTVNNFVDNLCGIV